MSASQTFKVGDVVEIIGSEKTALDLKRLVGRTGVITSLFISLPTHSIPNEPSAHLSPKELDPGNGWYCKSLRKINPPDWTAPLTTYREVEA